VTECLECGEYSGGKNVTQQQQRRISEQRSVRNILQTVQGTSSPTNPDILGLSPWRDGSTKQTGLDATARESNSAETACNA